MPRPIYKIADEITLDWKKVNYAARPYLDTMRQLYSIDDRYIAESAQDIVLGFLSNAGTWRGPVAQRIKAELNSMLKPARRNPYSTGYVAARNNPGLTVPTGTKVSSWWSLVAPRTYENTLGERICLSHYRGEGGSEWVFFHVTGPRDAYGRPATDSSDAAWNGKVLGGAGWETEQDALSTLKYAPSITHIELRRDSRGEQRNDEGRPLGLSGPIDYPSYSLQYGNDVLAQRFFLVGRRAQEGATRGRKNPRHPRPRSNSYARAKIQANTARRNGEVLADLSPSEAVQLLRAATGIEFTPVKYEAEYKGLPVDFVPGGSGSFRVGVSTYGNYGIEANREGVNSALQDMLAENVKLTDREPGSDNFYLSIQRNLAASARKRLPSKK